MTLIFTEMTKIDRLFARIADSSQSCLLIVKDVFWIVSHKSYTEMEGKDLMEFNDFGHTHAQFIFTVAGNNILFLKNVGVSCSDVRKFADEVGLDCKFFNYETED